MASRFPPPPRDRLPTSGFADSEQATAARPEAKVTDAGAQAGQGGLFVLGAKVFFILAGLVQQALLPRVIGLADYGALARVLAAANVPNNVVVSSSIQSVSRLVAQSGARDAQALRFAMRVHVIVALALAGAFAFAAPAIAAFQRAPHIVLPLVVMAVVLGVYAVYAPLVGALNGRRAFAKQATLDICAATFRTLGLAGCGFLFARSGHGALGAALGAALAALMVLPLAVQFTGILRRQPQAEELLAEGPFRAGAVPDADAAAPAKSPWSAARYLVAIGSLALAQLTTNLLMQSDLTLLGRQLSIAAQHQSVVDAATRADEWVGVYRACQLFAFLPYQLLVSVTSILFPLVAKAHAENDTRAVARITARGARLGMILAGLFITVVVAMPAPLLRVAFPGEIAERGAATLRILALGQGAFAITGLASTVLASLGKESRATMVNATACLFVVVLVLGFTGHSTFGELQLRQTALATSVAMGIALIVAGIFVYRAAGAFVPLATAVRVLLVSGACVGIVSQVPIHRGLIFTLLGLSGITLTYVVGLLLTRELARTDLDAVRTVFARRLKR